MTISDRPIYGKKDTSSTPTGRDYAVTWYCIQRGHREIFPDGFPVPNTKRTAFARSPRKLIWVKLGEGDSWKEAITFGPRFTATEQAAEDFCAKGIVWVEERIEDAYINIKQRGPGKRHQATPSCTVE